MPKAIKKSEPHWRCGIGHKHEHYAHMFNAMTGRVVLRLYCPGYIEKDTTDDD